MLFEEVLPLMRQGKKAKHARMRDNEYWICGNASIEGIDKWPTLIKIFENPFEAERYSYSWGIERWAIMADDWYIVDEDK